MAQIAGRAVIALGHVVLVHGVGQHHGGAGHEARAHGVDVLQADGHAATRVAREDAEALAVDPDAVTGLAAQPVHGIGVVQRIGDAAVFRKVQAAGDLVLDEVDALGRALVVDDLLVAGDLSCRAGEGVLEPQRALALEKQKGLTVFVHRHKM